MVEEPDVPFKYVDITEITIMHIQDIDVNGSFEITGVLKWIQEPRALFVGKSKTSVKVCSLMARNIFQ